LRAGPDKPHGTRIAACLGFADEHPVNGRAPADEPALANAQQGLRGHTGARYPWMNVFAEVMAEYVRF